MKINTRDARELTRDQLHTLDTFQRNTHGSLFSFVDEGGACVEADAQGILAMYHASAAWDSVESWLEADGDKVESQKAWALWTDIMQVCRKRAAKRARQQNVTRVTAVPCLCGHSQEQHSSCCLLDCGCVRYRTEVSS